MLRDFVFETVAAPGTADFTLLGPVTGRRAFNGTGAFASGAQAFYVADNNAGLWEAGYGLANVGTPNNTLTRAVVVANSLGTTAKVNFTGAVDVVCTLPAARTPILNADNVLVSGANGRIVGRGALVKLTASLSIANNTNTNVGWSAAEYDDASIWSAGSPTRLTVPTGWTRVRLVANLGFALNATGRRKLEVRKNNTTTAWGMPLVHAAAVNARSNLNGASPPVTVVAGDYFEVNVYQDSGAALVLQASGGETDNWFAMELIS